MTNKSNYDTDFVRRNTHSNTTADSNTQTDVKSGPVTTATLPYIRGTSETTSRILQPYNIRVAQKPITTLRLLLTNVNDKDKLEDRQGAVYKVKCYDCQAIYIGGTGEKVLLLVSGVAHTKGRCLLRVIMTGAWPAHRPGPTNFWFDHCTACNKLPSNLSLRTPLNYGQFVWPQKCQHSLPL